MVLIGVCNEPWIVIGPPLAGTGGPADLGLGRVPGSVSGPVLRHRPALPVPPEPGLRDVPAAVLRHVPHRGTAH